MNELLLSDAATSSPVLTLGPMSDVERFLIIYAEDNKEVVRISMKTGKVTVANPDQMDWTAQEFWKAVQRVSGGMMQQGNSSVTQK